MNKPSAKGRSLALVEHKKIRALLIALICLSVHSAAYLCAGETDQNILDQKSAEKIQLQQERFNAPHPDAPLPSFHEILEKAEQGNAQAEYLLARRYYFGEGVTRNREKAAQWHTKAANQGHATAQYVLGLLYSTGDGVHQDKEKAVAWITRAAGQGLAEAQFALGMMYRSGEDVPQNTQKAAELISKAAAQGNEEALKKAAEDEL